MELTIRKVGGIGFFVGFMISVILYVYGYLTHVPGENPAEDILLRHPVASVIGGGLVYGLICLLIFAFVYFVYTKLKKSSVDNH